MGALLTGRWERADDSVSLHQLRRCAPRRRERAGRMAECPKCRQPTPIPDAAAVLFSPPIPATVAEPAPPAAKAGIHSIVPIVITGALLALAAVGVFVFIVAASGDSGTSLLGGVICLGAAWFLIASPFALLGAMVASQKQAGIAGLVLGFAFGPLGAIAACFLDGRDKCTNCGTRLERIAQVCPACNLPVRLIRG